MFAQEDVLYDIDEKQDFGALLEHKLTLFQQLLKHG